jgi:hypothetical protein
VDDSVQARVEEEHAAQRVCQREEARRGGGGEGAWGEGERRGPREKRERERGVGLLAAGGVQGAGDVDTIHENAMIRD